MIQKDLLSQITLVIGVDSLHLRELRFVWPDWMRLKPELRQMPAIVFYDASQVRPSSMDFLQIHSQVRLIPWEMTTARNQREKMLTGFIHVPAREVTTPWYLKLDTNTAATKPGHWIREEWFQPDKNGELRAFIAPRWGYTKPRYAIDLLDDWADGVPELARFPRLNVHYTSSARRVCHRRIISWFFIGNTDWTRRILPWLDPGGRMPIPSQDTFVFYCAARSRTPYLRIGGGDLGWEHKRVWRMLRKESQSASRLPIFIHRSEKCLTDQTEAGKSTARGVIYFNSGTACVVRLLVSLWSLRKVYRGPVTIVSTGDASHTFCHAIGQALGAMIKIWEPRVPPGPNSVLLAKTRVHEASSYDTSVLIDSDTLVRQPIDDLFVWAEESGLVVTQMAQWTVRQRRIIRRLESWKELYPEWVQKALNAGPAINGGVMAFRNNSPLLVDWYRYALPGRANFIPDETCLQLLLHRYPHHVTSHRWNASCVYGRPRDEQTRIIHFHGRKHCRKGLPFNADLWIAAYDAVIRMNVADIRNWPPDDDKMLARFLRWRQTHPPSDGRSLASK